MEFHPAVDVAHDLVRQFGRQPVGQPQVLPGHHRVERVVGRRQGARGLDVENARHLEVRMRQVKGLVLIGEIETRGLEVDFIRRTQPLFPDQLLQHFRTVNVRAVEIKGDRPGRVLERIELPAPPERRGGLAGIAGLESGRQPDFQRQAAEGEIEIGDLGLQVVAHGAGQREFSHGMGRDLGLEDIVIESKLHLHLVELEVLQVGIAVQQRKLLEDGQVVDGRAGEAYFALAVDFLTCLVPLPHQISRGTTMDERCEVRRQHLGDRHLDDLHCRVDRLVLALPHAAIHIQPRGVLRIDRCHLARGNREHGTRHQDLEPVDVQRRQIREIERARVRDVVEILADQVGLDMRVVDVPLLVLESEGELRLGTDDRSALEMIRQEVGIPGLRLLGRDRPLERIVRFQQRNVAMVDGDALDAISAAPDSVEIDLGVNIVKIQPADCLARPAFAGERVGIDGPAVQV